MRWSLIFCLILQGCASLSTRLPDISTSDLAAEQRQQEITAFSEMKKHQTRLWRVAHPILRENAALCKKTSPDIGFETHTLKSYPKKIREAAKRELGASETPQVIYVRPGSPASFAGLKAGDIVRGPGGKAVGAHSKNLRAYLRDGTPLVRDRGGKMVKLNLTPETLCAYPVRLKMTAAINAYATNTAIIMTSGMMDFTQSDAELAMILGHELAHNNLGHIPKSIRNFVLSGGGTRYTRPFESEADYAGLYYSARAGYEIDNVEDLWRRLAALSLRPIARAKTHPTYPSRFVGIAATRKEIIAKRVKNQPVTPNMKSDP